jgi:hypothetical protein
VLSISYPANLHRQSSFLQQELFATGVVKFSQQDCSPLSLDDRDLLRLQSPPL